MDRSVALRLQSARRGRGSICAADGWGPSENQFATKSRVGVAVTQFATRTRVDEGCRQKGRNSGRSGSINLAQNPTPPLALLKMWFGSLLEVSQFLESDLPGVNSFGYFEACKSGANSFFPEPIPLELGSPTPKSTLFCWPKWLIAVNLIPNKFYYDEIGWNLIILYILS